MGTTTSGNETLLQAEHSPRSVRSAAGRTSTGVLHLLTKHTDTAALPAEERSQLLGEPTKRWVGRLVTGEGRRLESWKAFARISHDLDFREKGFGEDQRAKMNPWFALAEGSARFGLHTNSEWPRLSQQAGPWVRDWQGSRGPGWRFRSQGAPAAPG